MEKTLFLTLAALLVMPLTVPGLKNHPQCDDEVKKIGEELWGGKTRKG